MRNKELIVIAGPTGIGKTDISIKIAKSFGTEIISADSRQIYREMTIGTAVPSPVQLSTIKHHFIQCRSIREYYNASMYEKEVLKLLKTLFLKHEKVILTGGTGLYIDAVRNGIDDLPSADSALRKELQERIREEGLESLRKELKYLDPVSYRNIDLKNPKRVQKALEVSISTGRPYSSFLMGQRKKRDFSVKLIALNTKREELYRRINERTDLMIKAGLVGEAKDLIRYRNENALRTVGYKEIFAYLEGQYSLNFAVEKIKANTRKYARKQITWFRKDPAYTWFSPDAEKDLLEFIKKRKR